MDRHPQKLYGWAESTKTYEIGFGLAAKTANAALAPEFDQRGATRSGAPDKRANERFGFSMKVPEAFKSKTVISPFAVADIETRTKLRLTATANGFAEGLREELIVALEDEFDGPENQLAGVRAQIVAALEPAITALKTEIKALKAQNAVDHVKSRETSLAELIKTFSAELEKVDEQLETLTEAKLDAIQQLEDQIVVPPIGESLASNWPIPIPSNA